MQGAKPSSYAVETANSVIKIISKAFDIHSPSRMMRDMFQNVGEGAVLGLEDECSKIIGTMEEIGVDGADAMQKALSLDVKPTPKPIAQMTEAEQNFEAWIAHTLPAAAASIVNNRSITVKMENHFGDTYKRRDGAAALRDDLDRGIGELMK